MVDKAVFYWNVAYFTVAGITPRQWCLGVAFLAALIAVASPSWAEHLEWKGRDKTLPEATKEKVRDFKAYGRIASAAAILFGVISQVLEKHA